MRPRVLADLAALAICAAVSACSSSPPDPTPSPAVARATPAATRVAPAPTPVRTPVATPRPLRPGDFDAQRAMDHNYGLAVTVGKREAGTDGDRRAQAYLRDALIALGYEVELDTFALPQGGTSANVIGVPGGFDPAKRYLIVGGHYDSLNGQGSNDNASGIAVALEIARDLRAVRAALPVLFVAFGAEEVQPAAGKPHHVGSRHYVARMSAAARKNLVSFVNLDQVGRGPGVICGRLRRGPVEGTQRLLRIAAELGIRAREQVTPDWSDNGSFLREGLNAGWLWTGEDPGHYHNPADTIDRIQLRTLSFVGRLALATLRSYR